MRKALIVGFDEKGVAKQIAAPGLYSDRRKQFTALKHGDLPKGVVSVELYTRESQTTGIDRAAQKRRLDAMPATTTK